MIQLKHLAFKSFFKKAKDYGSHRGHFSRLRNLSYPRQNPSSSHGKGTFAPTATKDKFKNKTEKNYT